VFFLLGELQMKRHGKASNGNALTLFRARPSSFGACHTVLAFMFFALFGADFTDARAKCARFARRPTAAGLQLRGQSTDRGAVPALSDAFTL
jgi:hypothetical protein